MHTVSILLPDTQAGMTGYLHEELGLVPGKKQRPCVVVCPGGGYRYRSPREAEPPAVAFFAQGYNVFILAYSVADDTPTPLGIGPLRQLSEAVIYLRQHADALHVAPQKIAVCGFSAGAHLCASLGTLWASPALGRVQDTRGGLNRPDAMILCYPVISAGEFAHRGSFDNLTGNNAEDNALFSLERQVTPGAAPAFLWHTQDDQTVPVENTLLMADALRRNNVPFECHIFPHGMHGLAMCNAETDSPHSRCKEWFSLCTQWLADQL